MLTQSLGCGECPTWNEQPEPGVKLVWLGPAGSKQCSNHSVTVCQQGFQHDAQREGRVKVRKGMETSPYLRKVSVRAPGSRMGAHILRHLRSAPGCGLGWGSRGGRYWEGGVSGQRRCLSRLKRGWGEGPCQSYQGGRWTAPGFVADPTLPRAQRTDRRAPKKMGSSAMSRRLP